MVNTKFKIIRIPSNIVWLLGNFKIMTLRTRLSKRISLNEFGGLAGFKQRLIMTTLSICQLQ